MEFTLTRTDFKDTGIFGTLEGEGLELATLEHNYDCKPKLPDGVYTCIRGQHVLHSGPVEAFEVQNVPGHTGILLHVGNYNQDSEGCVLLGLAHVGDMITGSKSAFNEFMSKLTGIDSFTLTVSSS